MRNLLERTFFCLTCDSEVAEGHSAHGHNVGHQVKVVAVRDIAWANRLDRLFDRVEMSEQAMFFDEEN